MIRQLETFADCGLFSAVSSFEWTKSPGDSKRGPYAHSRNQWVGYDDVEMVRRKAQFVAEEGYGGATLWTIDLDDFNNLCCQGVNPLLNAASSVLRSEDKLFAV